MRRILVIGIAAALLIGLLVATATATVEQTSGEVDGSPITVPDGKVGDEVRYAWFSKSPKVESAHADSSGSSSGSASAESRSTADEDGWYAAGTEVTRIERLGKSVDQDGRVHDVIVVRSNSTFGDYHGTSVSYVELAKRSLVRNDYESDWAGADISHTLAYSSFYAAGNGMFFEHQGQTYQLGQTVDDVDSPFLCGATGYSVGWGGSAGAPAGVDAPVPGHRTFNLAVEEFDCDDFAEYLPEIVSTKTWVANRGIVNGYDAYDIRTETVLKMAEVSVSMSSDGESTVERGAEYEMQIVRDQWVSADVPYVLLDEVASYRDDAELGRSQNVLQDYRPGSEPIPWNDGPLPPVPILERSTTSPQPSDGKGSKLPYSLSAGIADATGQLAPVPFKVWQQTHPAAKLVSARLSIGENSRSAQPSVMWSLFWAEPDGEAHEVVTERMQGVSTPLVTDRGDTTIPAFDPSILPSGLVTIAEAEKAWTILAPEEYASRGPNYVSWGLEIDSTEGLTCLGSGSSSTAQQPEARLRTLYVGWLSEGSCQELAPEIEASILAIDAEAGELIALVEFHDDFDLEQGPMSPHRASFEPQSSVGSFEIVKPDIAVATVTSSSLLAIFLAAYFLPALKVVGAQALLLMPGYAKLRKDAILDNKIRDQILDTIKQDPGVSITDLAKKVDAGWGTIVYHLGVLEKNKMVSTVLDGRHRRVFPVGLVDFSSQGQLALLKNERVRALYELIHDEPGVFQDQLAKRIGISAPATSWHLKRLEDAGLVGRVKDGRRVHYYANQKPEVHTPDGMEIA